MKIYCSGIGGIGLSAYAAQQRARGHEVMGSDLNQSPVTDGLQQQGIEVNFNQDGSQVPTDADLLVYSEAIPEAAPERKKAADLGLKQISYFAALGELSEPYQIIAVAGTHGKSSTTAMAARVMLDAGVNPNIVVGTKLRELEGKNWQQSDSELFLLEACEYRRSFNYLSPNIVLLTNCDGDHFDYYKSVDDYQAAFKEFIQRLPEEGLVITHLNDPDCAKVVAGIAQRVVDASVLPLPTLGTPGKHMQQNAQLVLALAKELGIKESAVLKSLERYRGCWRRMEVYGETESGVLVIDDYAHHPREIKAVIEGVKEAYPERRIVCAYQPHTHERTLTFYDEFCKSFTGSDLVLVADVYEARKDIEQAQVDLDKYITDIKNLSQVEVHYGGSLEAMEELLKTKLLKPNDVLLTLGAGTITNLAGTVYPG